MGAIHLSEVRCSGQEPSLWKCPHKNITAEDCSHSQDAGVRCNLPYTGVETKVSYLPSLAQESHILSNPGHDLQPDSFPAHCPRPLPSCSSHLVPPLASPYVALNQPSATHLLQTPTTPPQKLTRNFHCVTTDPTQWGPQPTRGASGGANRGTWVPSLGAHLWG